MELFLLVFLVVIVAIAVALVLVVRALLQERRTSRSAPARTTPRVDRDRQRSERGDQAERRVTAILDGLPAEEYRAYHELFPTRAHSAWLTEVDHVVVSPFGVFVIETKGVYGDVWVDPDADAWQIDRRGTGVDTMRNPLGQNHMHLQAVASVLELPEPSWLRSIVCFADDETRLRGTALDNVMTRSRLHDYIVGFRNPVLNEEGVDRLVRVLDELDARTDELRIRHRRELQERGHWTEP